MTARRKPLPLWVRQALESPPYGPTLASDAQVTRWECLVIGMAIGAVLTAAVTIVGELIGWGLSP